jgi:hypothetical protein
MSFTLWIPLKEGIGEWKQAQRQDEDRVTLRITILYDKFYLCLKIECSSMDNMKVTNL